VCTAQEKADRHKAWRQQRLALHASDNPPAELQPAPPRKVRLTRKGFLLEFAAAMSIALPLIPVYLNHIVDQAKMESARFVQQERIKFDQIQDPNKKHWRENWIRRVALDNDERFSKGTVALHQLIWILSACPLAYALGLAIQLRRMRLLQKGFLARGTVVHLRWRKLAVISFFNADGKEFCIKTFNCGLPCGDEVWLLYLPNRPKVACVYYLPRQPLMRIVPG
jgi:hypothetical protein